MSADPLAPFALTSGPRDAKIVFVGEAWGAHEQQAQAPLVGASGIELFRMIEEAWSIPTGDVVKAQLAWMDNRISRDGMISLRDMWLQAHSVLLTNVFPLRPQDNQMDNICASKAEVGDGYSFPLLRQGKYIRPEYLPHVARLSEELAVCSPNLIVALGNTACWALLRATNIGSIRGAIAATNITLRGNSSGLTAPPQLKVLPTYHPAGVLRNWAWRTIVIQDLIKAKHESKFPEIRRPKRKVLVNPTLEEASAWADSVLAEAPPWLSVDIETGARQIKCIGFARSKGESCVVPFVDLSHPSGCYWPTADAEQQAMAICERLLASPIPKLFQNGIYDLQYLLRAGYTIRACEQDTMLLHHAMFPELNKGLGFLGSIYTQEASWKLMRKTDTFKRDE